MLRTSWVLCLTLFTASLIACSGAGNKPPEATDPEAKAKRQRELAEAESRWETRLAQMRSDLADEKEILVADAEEEIVKLTAERDEGAKKYKETKGKAWLTPKQDADLKAKQKEREDAVVAAIAKRDAAKKAGAAAHTWEPRESPATLPRGEVARMHDDLVFVTVSAPRPGELIGTCNGATYWFEGMPHGNVSPGDHFTVPAIVEYTGDRDHNGHQVRVIRVYSQLDEYDRSEVVTHGTTGVRTVYVRGYTRRDGTVVHPHTRKPPVRRR